MLYFVAFAINRIPIAINNETTRSFWNILETLT